MIKRLIILFVFSLCVFNTYSQSVEYTHSGYTSLSIHLSGEIPAQLPDIVRPHTSSPFIQDRPLNFDVINDSTMVLSFFTFGPTTVYFTLNGQPKNTILLPNQQDELYLHYTDGENYTMDYSGHFKEMFDNSHMFYAGVQEFFSSDYFVAFEPVSYRTAVAYRDDILQRIANLQERIGKNISSPFVRKFFQMGMETNNKTLFLFDSFESTYLAYTKQMDEQRIELPERDLSYYTGIIHDRYADTTYLLAMNFNLLRSIRQSPPLELPAISETGYTGYKDRLVALFGSTFPQGRNNLFYDLMLAGAYIDQINEEKALSLLQRHEIMRHFQNKHISNYILYQDDMSIKRRSLQSTGGGAHHLPFDKENLEVLKDILSKYKGKVVVMDFWATWCGPCMEAHDLIKPVKAQYADHKDVVFVYITNETSDYVRWKDYVSVLGGEHYYLHNAQHSAITTHYEITSIPSYLIFDTEGRLTASSLGKYMGNEMATEWIEQALTIKQ